MQETRGWTNTPEATGLYSPGHRAATMMVKTESLYIQSTDLASVSAFIPQYFANKRLSRPSSEKIRASVDQYENQFDLICGHHQQIDDNERWEVFMTSIYRRCGLEALKETLAGT